MRKWLCTLALTAVMGALPITAYGAAGWVKNGEVWNYYREDGSMLKNDFTPDGYYVDRQGKYVPLDTTGDWSNKERSANMFFKYLETGDSYYLLGSDKIEPGKETGSFNSITGKKYLSWVDYQSCARGGLFPTRRSGFMTIAGLFDPGDIYPDRELTKEGAYWRAKFDPRKVSDEYQVPVYFMYYGRSMNDYGDYNLLTGTKKLGITVHEVATQDTEKYPNAEKRNLITQKDMYKAIRSFISEGLAGTENMSEKELAEHLETYLDQKLYYSYTKCNAIENGGNKDLLNFPAVYSILSGSGVCDDYSQLYKVLADAAGLDCVIEKGNTPEGISHAWNVVEINGVNYHVDATYADGNSQYKGLMTSCHINGDKCQYK